MNSQRQSMNLIEFDGKCPNIGERVEPLRAKEMERPGKRDAKEIQGRGRHRKVRRLDVIVGLLFRFYLVRWAASVVRDRKSPFFYFLCVWRRGK